MTPNEWRKLNEARMARSEALHWLLMSHSDELIDAAKPGRGDCLPCEGYGSIPNVPGQRAGSHLCPHCNGTGWE